MSIPLEKQQSAKVAKLAFAVNERAAVVAADFENGNPPDRELIRALNRQAMALMCATNELNNISLGQPQPPPAPH